MDGLCSKTITLKFWLRANIVRAHTWSEQPWYFPDMSCLCSKHYIYIPVQIVDAYLSYVLLFQETEWLTAVHGLDGKCRPPQRQSLSSDVALCRRRSFGRVLLDYIRDAKHHWSSFEDLQGTTLTRFLQWPRCQTTMHHNDWWLRRREKFHQNGLFRHSGTTLLVPRPAGDGFGMPSLKFCMVIDMICSTCSSGWCTLIAVKSWMNSMKLEYSQMWLKGILDSQHILLSSIPAKTCGLFANAVDC